MEIQQYLRTLRDSWWIVLAAFLVSVALGLGYSYSQTPQYEATATFVANPSVRVASSSEVLNSLDTLARRSGLVSTYCEILGSEAIQHQAVAALGLPDSLVQDYEVQCVVLPDSSILALTAQGPSPYLAADLSNAVGAAGVTYIKSLQEVFELRRLDQAQVVLEPTRPNHAVDLALSAIIGLMGGVAFIFVREAIERPFSRVSGAIVDPTAGTASMQYLRQRLEEEISRSRLQNYPLNLALIAFRPLDDLSQYPATVVQQLRRQLAVFLQDRSRPLDLVAYVKDDTFGVLMPEINGLEARDRLASLLLDLRLKVFGLNDMGLSVNFQGTAGVVENSGGEIDWRAMLRLSQEAVEAATLDGPYQVHLTRTSPGPFFEMLVAEN